MSEQATLFKLEAPPERDLSAPRSSSFDGNARQTFLQIVQRWGPVKIGKHDDAFKTLVAWKESPSGWQCWARPDATHEMFELQVPVVEHVRAVAGEWSCQACGSLGGQTDLEVFEGEHLFCKPAESRSAPTTASFETDEEAARSIEVSGGRP